jgi:hypothetical protein
VLALVGLTFVVVVLITMSIGVAAAIHYSYIAPCLARRRQRKLERASYDDSPTLAQACSPYLDKNPGELASPQLAEENNMYANLFVKEDSREISLSPPAPTYAADKRGRLSTLTQDGIWWVV